MLSLHKPYRVLSTCINVNNLFNSWFVCALLGDIGRMYHLLQKIRLGATNRFIPAGLSTNHEWLSSCGKERSMRQHHFDIFSAVEIIFIIQSTVDFRVNIHLPKCMCISWNLTVASAHLSKALWLFMASLIKGIIRFVLNFLNLAQSVVNSPSVIHCRFC